ncbi:MAG: hypothetical protein R3F14_13000 [Polyangiaceae bacterium]
MQCCSQFCDPNYKLCGQCEGTTVGAACSPAIPCCSGLACEDGKCAPAPP